MRPRSQGDNSPIVPEFVATVVMPVRNEERFLAAALDAVLAQDVADGALEVLVVDGCSTDRTREIVEERARAARFPVRLLENPDQIAATALNLGIAAASADVVVRVDGHCAIPTEYVSRLIGVLERTGGVDAAGGSVVPVGRGDEGNLIACAMQGPLGHGGAAFRSTGGEGERDADTVAFPAYRKAALERVGGFDAQMVRNQDDDLHYRLRQAGSRIVLVPDLIVRYRCRETVDGVFRQYFGYGFWKVVGWAKRGRPSSWRALGPALLIAWIVGWAIALAAAFVAAVAAAPETAPETVAETALFYGFSYLLLQMLWFVPLSLTARWTSPREQGLPRFFHRVEWIVMVMHVAYGLGFWSGVLRCGRPPARWG
jgi:succinoglycan biosynthesis protein ExoA